MVVADLGAAQAAEKFLRPVRASAIIAVGFLVIDALHFELGVEAVPRRRFVGVDDRSLCDARTDK